ncbi:MAG: hypothetical protein RR519_04610 [Victivallaceae bacterium]
MAKATRLKEEHEYSLTPIDVTTPLIKLPKTEESETERSGVYSEHEDELENIEGSFGPKEEGQGSLPFDEGSTSLIEPLQGTASGLGTNEDNITSEDEVVSCGENQESKSFGATSEPVSIFITESKDEQDWSLLVDAAKNKLRETFNEVFDINTVAIIKGNLLRDQKNLYLAAIEGFITNLQFNPFKNTSKEAHSESEGAMNIYIGEMESNLPDLPPGKFVVSNRCSSIAFRSVHPHLTHWDLVYRLSGPFLGSEGFDPNVEPEEVYGALITAFSRLFDSCINKGITVVQLPLLSCRPEMPEIKQDVLDLTTITAISDSLSSLQASVLKASISLCPNRNPAVKSLKAYNS